MAKPSGRRTSQFQLSQGQPQPSVPSLENNFVAGLKTEYTGLNFPENACTSTSNCVFSLVGDVSRREGIDYEAGFRLDPIGTGGGSIATYKWNNAGGDGSTQIYVLQALNTLYFFQVSNSTLVFPMSTTRLSTTVDLTQFTPQGGPQPLLSECQFADGNGYLFVFHPALNPFYCAFSAGTITATAIDVQIRDFVGVPEPGIADNTRPIFLIAQHLYNLQNQGWTSGAPWATTSVTPNVLSVGGHTWSVGSGLAVNLGDNVQIQVTSTGSPFVGTQTIIVGYGTAVNYTGTSLTLNVTGITNNPFLAGRTYNNWTFTANNTNYISTWQTDVGNFPSNADVWWTFKTAAGAFNPTTTVSQVTLGTGPAPKGFYILDAFSQTRSLASSVANISDVTTLVRPKTGTWFQGRVWYTGVDASFPAQGNAPFSTWAENIYFSQTITNTAQFGRCYQTNDPTSETLFDLLPSDGGVIQIQGCGSIYKLFPIQTGLLVFAANGVWQITGSTGIGFAANDFTVIKISGVQSISSTSFVNVNGLPVFWNEEGIYAVSPAKAAQRNNEVPSLEVTPITLRTILSFYNSIPLQSKKFVRGDYNPITYVMKWVYRSTNETSINDRYHYDSVLNFNTSNQAFYPYTLPGTPYPNIAGITYVAGPGGSTSPAPTFKFLVINGNNISFAEESNINYVDWQGYDGVGTNFNSFFVTGYRLKGQAQRKFQPQYIYIYSEIPVYSYKLQGVWSYASNLNSNQYSTEQVVTANQSTFAKGMRKFRIRGNGYVMQLKINSIAGKPFKISGWSILDTIGIQ